MAAGVTVASPGGNLCAPAASSGRAGPREPSAWKNPPIEEAPDTGHPGFKATIPVYFHVFTSGSEGRLSVTDLKQQINVLNTDYAGREGGFATGFSFTYAGVDYTDNSTWFNALDPGTSVERTAKAATHVGDASVLNAWTTNGPSYLGFATFPSWYKRSPQLDGVVLDYKSFLGGPFGDQFSLGKTATHEVGHWLGALHTFQGGCNAKATTSTTRRRRRRPPAAAPRTRTPARRRARTRFTTTWTTRSTRATTSSPQARPTGCTISGRTSAQTEEPQSGTDVVHA